ncbi:hypothetical protein SUGI_1095900 [Cryptomeria japonica]|nr:hypothetical protein SUGI_1095900 [Cryptomeria japonica]
MANLCTFAPWTTTSNANSSAGFAIFFSPSFKCVDVLLNHANGHEFASIAGAGNWCARISSYIERGRILSVSVLSS